MQDQERLAERFEEHRPHLRAVAYRMLGSLSDADDAVQEAWLRLSRSSADDIENLGGWLTTVVARVCLNMLHARKTRREEPLEVRVPEPIVSAGIGGDPEQEALLADSVGLALQVVLETLAPAERLAFVLHDMFAVPFDEIAPMVGRSTTAARQMASRARRRVQTAANVPDRDLGRQWQVVDAFMDASRNLDFEALVAVLDPDVVLRADAGAPHGVVASRVLRGAEAVARGAASFSSRPAPDRVVRRSLVNGAAGVVVFEQGRPVSVMGFTVAGGRIVEMNVLADPERLARLDLAGLHG
jgi:RNA polymerase sigma factor (sigma-70 family)